MNKKLLYSLLGLFIGLVISFSANADLDKAIAFAEAGDVKKGTKKLVKKVTKKLVVLKIKQQQKKLVVLRTKLKLVQKRKLVM